MVVGDYAMRYKRKSIKLAPHGPALSSPPLWKPPPHTMSSLNIKRGSRGGREVKLMQVLGRKFHGVTCMPKGTQ